jgi:hypothetical protein
MTCGFFDLDPSEFNNIPEWVGFLQTPQTEEFLISEF